MKKSLAVGDSSFVSIIERKSYYVDKTGYIKTVMESGNFVQLITRPRRFGKTLFVDALSNFLAVNPTDPCDTSFQKELFDGLAITRHKEFCQQYMGKVPVLSLSFKGCDGTDFASAYRALMSYFATVAQKHEYLLESEKLSKWDKSLFSSYCSLQFMQNLENKSVTVGFISGMVTFLAKHFERRVVLLIDEYDVPLAKASSRGYYADMCEFIRGCLQVLKPEFGPTIEGLPVLRNAVLTGCLRVSKESIFTGVNNFSVDTVCSDSDAYACAMGFTEAETSKILDYYDLSSRKKDVKQWYDGYRFGSHEIYCPWDVINFCSAARIASNPKNYAPQNYWSGTSGPEVIDEFLGFLSGDEADRMQTLLDGGTIELAVNDQLTYADIANHKSQDFWTLLLYTGYLTVSERLGAGRLSVRIPNEEIRHTFQARVQQRFSKVNQSFVEHGVKFAQAAVSGDIDAMINVLEPLLRNYVSVRDTATRAPAENYYHGFLAALLASAGESVQDFRSNVEAGNGYADIVFSNGFGSKRVGVVIEIKYVKKPEYLRSSVEGALAQIDSKGYGEFFEKMRCLSS